MKEAACLTQIEILREKFAEASQNKDSCNKGNDNIAVIELGDDDSICNAESDEENKEFIYHSSDGSVEKEGEDHGKLGQDADGSSPMATRSKQDAKKQDDLPNWLNEINLIQLYDKPELLSALMNQIFPCIACSNHKNISNPKTRVPIFLRKSGTTSWELFYAEFDELSHVLEWDGNEGLGNLWGLYYWFLNADSIKSFTGHAWMRTRHYKRVSCGTRMQPPLEKVSPALQMPPLLQVL